MHFLLPIAFCKAGDFTGRPLLLRRKPVERKMSNGIRLMKGECDRVFSLSLSLCINMMGFAVSFFFFLFFLFVFFGFADLSMPFFFFEGSV